MAALTTLFIIVLDLFPSSGLSPIVAKIYTIAVHIIRTIIKAATIYITTFLAVAIKSLSAFQNPFEFAVLVLKKFTSKMYYRVLQSLTRVPIQKDTGDFRLLDRRCVNALRKLRESQRCDEGRQKRPAYEVTV